MLPASNLHVRPRPGGTCVLPLLGNRSEPCSRPCSRSRASFPGPHASHSYSPEKPQRGKAIGEKNPSSHRQHCVELL